MNSQKLLEIFATNLAGLVPERKVPVRYPPYPSVKQYVYPASELAVATGYYEWDLVKEFSKIVQGKTVFDIGSYIGTYGLVALAAGANQVVFCEPYPASAERIEENISVNGFNNRAIIINKAVSDEVGYVTLDTSDDPQKNSIIRDYNDGIEVKTTTLNHISNSYSLKPEILKIDVEGAAGQVISGGIDVLPSTHHIIAEIHHDEERETVLSELDSTDFAAREFDETHLVFTNSIRSNILMDQ